MKRQSVKRKNYNVKSVSPVVTSGDIFIPIFKERRDYVATSVQITLIICLTLIILCYEGGGEE